MGPTYSGPKHYTLQYSHQLPAQLCVCDGHVVTCDSVLDVSPCYCVQVVALTHSQQRWWTGWFHRVQMHY